MGVKVGILGCGWIAEHAHIPVLLKLQAVDVVALYDSDGVRARNLAFKYGVSNAYSDFDEFLKCGIEAAVIATPNYTHAPYSKKLLEHNVDVMCEKPVALSEVEIREVLNLANQNNLIYFPGMVNRYRDDVQRMLKLVKEKKIGSVKEIEAGWIRKNGVPRPGTWFTKRCLSGGGVLVDLGAHILDICFMLIENEQPLKCKLEASICDDNRITEKAAEWFQKDYDFQYGVDVEDNVKAEITFLNNLKVNVNLSWFSSSKADYTYFSILGEDGRIELKTLFGFSNNRLWGNDTLSVDVDRMKEQVYLGDGDNITLKAFEKMHVDFIDKVLNRNMSDFDILSALNVVAITEKLYSNCNVVDRKLLDYQGMLGI